jgi:hypothetical protein
LPDWLKPAAKLAFGQLRHLAKADRLWPFTSTNAKVLLEAGMDPARIRIVEPAIEWSTSGTLADKKTMPAPRS